MFKSVTAYSDTPDVKNRKKTRDLKTTAQLILKRNPFVAWLPLLVIPFLVLGANPRGFWAGFSGARKVATVGGDFRRIASASNDLTLETEVRLYGDQGSPVYFPRAAKVFARPETFVGRMEIKTSRVLSKDESVQCKWFTETVTLEELPRRTPVGEFQLDPNGVSEVSVPSAMSRVFCSFISTSFSIDLSVQVKDILAPEPADALMLKRKIEEEKALIAQYTDASRTLDALERDPKLFDTVVQELNRIPALANNTKQSRVSFNVSQGMVTAFEIGKGDWYRIDAPTGQAKPSKLGLKWRGPEGAEKPLVLMRRDDIVWPESNFFSLVCGFESGSTGRLNRLLFGGNVGITYGRVGKPGVIRCAFNTVPKKWDSAIGEFSFGYRHVKRAPAQEWIAKSVADLNATIVNQLDLIASYQRRENERAQSRAVPYFKQISQEVARLKNLEPVNYCKRYEAYRPSMNFKWINAISMKGGEYCSAPITWDHKTYFATCDGEKEDEKLKKKNDQDNGRIVRFDSNLKLIGTDRVPTTEKGFPSVFNGSNAVVRYDTTSQKFYDFAMGTADGRVIFASETGIRMGELKFGNKLITHLRVAPNGNAYGMAVGAASEKDRNGILFAIGTDRKLIWEKEVPYELSVNPELALSQDFILVANGNGSLVLYDYQGEQTLVVPFESGMSSSKIAVLANVAYFGTSNGKVFRYDIAAGQLKELYQASWSGQVDPTTASMAQPHPMPRAITHQPYVSANGDIVVMTTYDGRMHFLNPDGTLKKLVQVKTILFTTYFGSVWWALRSEPLLVASSAGYMNLFTLDGTLIGQFDLGDGGELYAPPVPTATTGMKTGEQFLLGEFRGIRRYEMKPDASLELQTEVLDACTAP
ncbi:MAG: PQQ-like beta-propeller repeat protein [Bdellovibrionales bacterium]|nr:PQQ-like beta-propeller repeat protein [Bdellovibrionales bacterium]